MIELPLSTNERLYRERTAQRTLRHLPDQMLSALARSLSRHADYLTGGTLFYGEDVCAVGAMLRDLYPEECGTSRVFSLGPASILTLQGVDFGASTIRLAHIEYWFDATARLMAKRAPELDAQQVFRITGLWLGCLCLDELEERASTPLSHHHQAALATA